jgi:peroxiredoxin
MRMRNIASLSILLMLGYPALAAAPVPRDSPELIIVDPTGNAVSLSSFKGQVVVIEFLLVRCASCLRVAQTVNKLYGELAGRGFRPIGVVFDEGIGGPAVRSFADLLKINYPVGYATSDKVDSYLGRAMIERLQVPQVVVIDRAGVIRAQSRPTGELNLTDENYLRNLVRELLNEGAPPGKTEKTTFPPRTAG